MTTKAAPVSRAAVEDVYEDVAEIIRQTARRFARRYRRDFEETLADACLYFLEGYHTYVTQNGIERGRLQSRLVFTIWSKLWDARHREIYIWERFRGFPLEDARPAVAKSYEGHIDFEQLKLWLGDDANLALRLLFDSPPDLAAAIRADPNPGPQSIVRHLRDYLAALPEWDLDRARAAMSEVRRALS